MPATDIIVAFAAGLSIAGYAAPSTPAVLNAAVAGTSTFTAASEEATGWYMKSAGTQAMAGPF